MVIVFVLETFQVINKSKLLKTKYRFVSEGAMKRIVMLIVMGVFLIVAAIGIYIITQSKTCSPKCKTGLYCVNKACVKCRNASDCGDGYTCIEGDCVPDGECANVKCPNQVCNPITEKCVDCNTTVDCQSGDICVNNKCVNGSQCHGVSCLRQQVCNPTTGECVDCNTTMDCYQSGSTCVNNVCVAPPWSPAISFTSGTFPNTTQEYIYPYKTLDSNTCIDQGGKAAGVFKSKLTPSSSKGSTTMCWGAKGVPFQEFIIPVLTNKNTTQSCPHNSTEVYTLNDSKLSSKSITFCKVTNPFEFDWTGKHYFFVPNQGIRACDKSEGTFETWLSDKVFESVPSGYPYGYSLCSRIV